MHITRIKMKNGKILEGWIEKFRPIEGYLTFNGSNKKIMFKDMVSAVTEGERISLNKIGNEDELQRARDYLKSARENKWDKITPDFPKQEWE